MNKTVNSLSPYNISFSPSQGLHLTKSSIIDEWPSNVESHCTKEESNEYLMIKQNHVKNVLVKRQLTNSTNY